MREDIDCLTSVAKLRELFEEWKSDPESNPTTSRSAFGISFFDWLTTRDNDPRFVAMAQPADEWDSINNVLLEIRSASASRRDWADAGMPEPGEAGT